MLRPGLFRPKLEPYHPATGKAGSETVSLIGIMRHSATGSIDNIKVKFKGTEDPLVMKRCCPKCRQELFPSYGMHPIFVVAALGDLNAGKSAWLGSVAYPENISAVNKAEYPYRLEAITPTAPAEPDANTSERSLGKTSLLRIRNARANHRVVADVLLMDVSGEYYRKSPEENSFLWNILCEHGSYPGADGVVFLDPADRNQTEDTSSEDLKFNPAMIFNECFSRGIFSKKPLAYIRSRTDKLLASRQLPTVLDSAGSTPVPLFDQNTFPLPTSYRQEETTGRMAVEHSITKYLSGHILSDNGQMTVQGFMVQSCQDSHTSDSEEPIRLYQHNMNVMDPLVWILNRLQIFPLS